MLNKKKKTVLVLGNNAGGLWNFRREILQNLLETNNVAFCVPSGEFVDDIIKMGCDYIPCELLERRGTNPIKDIRLLSFYIHLITRINPDIVLTYTIKPNVYGGISCQITNTPYISNITGLGTTIENGGFLSWISLILYRIGLKKSKCVFFQNKENKAFFIRKKVTRGKTQLIPGSGVNINLHSLEPYPSDVQGIHFLFAGRIMKDKGIEELLSAIEGIHAEHRNVLLDIVGFCDEDYSQALKDAEERGVIVFHGFQSSMHDFYKNSHCVVLPSYHEGMANVMLEGSSTGRPVITTRVPGCQETFDEGITGFGCDAKSAESLKNAMLKFLSISQTEREKMGKAARLKMIQEFDRNIVVKAYKEEIEAASK